MVENNFYRTYRTADRTYSANIIGQINVMVDNNFYRTYRTADRTYSANIIGQINAMVETTSFTFRNNKEETK